MMVMGWGLREPSGSCVLGPGEGAPGGPVPRALPSPTGFATSCSAPVSSDNPHRPVSPGLCGLQPVSFSAGHSGSCKDQGHPCGHRRGECGLSSPCPASAALHGPSVRVPSSCTGRTLAGDGAASARPRVPEGHPHAQPHGVQPTAPGCGECVVSLPVTCSLSHSGLGLGGQHVVAVGPQAHGWPCPLP